MEVIRSRTVLNLKKRNIADGDTFLDDKRSIVLVKASDPTPLSLVLIGTVDLKQQEMFRYLSIFQKPGCCGN